MSVPWLPSTRNRWDSAPIHLVTSRSQQAQHHLRPPACAPKRGSNDCASSITMLRGREQGVGESNGRSVPSAGLSPKTQQAKSAERLFCPGTKKPWPILHSVCPKFRGARTAAHNQVRKRISSLLVKLIQDRWKLQLRLPWPTRVCTSAACLWPA